MFPPTVLNSSLSQPKILKLQLRRNTGEYKASLGISSVPSTLLQASIHTYLHPIELQQYQKIAAESKKHSFLHGKFLAKKVVGHYLGEADLKTIRIKSGVFEQPLVVYLSADTPMVSISHTSTHAACLAFSDEHPMAIDMEEITSNAKEYISPQITSVETNLNDTLQEDENVFYTRLWTVKEALSKVLKTGLMTPLEIYQVEAIHAIPDKEATLSTFSHFGQYKVLSFSLKNNICSIVLPKQTTISAILPDDF